MFSKHIPLVASAALLAFCVALPAKAQTPHIKKVFVVALENHNWRQPTTVTAPQPLYLNPAAPFLNSLVNGQSAFSKQVAWAKAYRSTGVHPSETNYLWSEAGSNLGVTTDNNPYNVDYTPLNVQSTTQHLSAFLTLAGKKWRSYQEDANVDATGNALPLAQWTVPLYGRSGVLASPGANAYNYSNRYDYETKHNPMVLFADTNGGCDTTTSNAQRLHYHPLQRLGVEISVSGGAADYNWITPDQFNDMHSTLPNGYGQFPNAGAAADSARIAAADNFLARIVPLLMSSPDYQDDGAILLWWDETEGGDNANFSIPFVVISKLVKPNANGFPYANTISYSHSSTLRTMQEIFGVDPIHGFPWLGAAATATDLADLFIDGVIAP